MKVLNDWSQITHYKEQIRNQYSIDTSILEWRCVERGECILNSSFH